MSCYFRHLASLFEEAGIDLQEVKADGARKRELDARLHALVGVEYKDCPLAWRKLKEMLSDEEGRKKLVEALRG
ncbi:MAG: hypothetical protein H5T74_05160 [Actinobacteria bacterium]|nr:hypothetical protein [Actinomycetota bacterium]